MVRLENTNPLPEALLSWIVANQGSALKGTLMVYTGSSNFCQLQSWKWKTQGITHTQDLIQNIHTPIYPQEGKAACGRGRDKGPSSIKVLWPTAALTLQVQDSSYCSRKHSQGFSGLLRSLSITRHPFGASRLITPHSTELTPCQELSIKRKRAPSHLHEVEVRIKG